MPLLSLRRRLRLTLLVCSCLLVPATAAAQVPDSVPDPFHGIAVRTFQNGLTAWFKRVPGAATVSISVSVPFGSDLDPPGQEQLAHVVEHALFSARDGRSEEQITREISDRGGSFNASTSPDRVHAWVSVGREHGLFALDWMHQRFAPRTWSDSILPGIRAAVALENGVGPPTLLDWVRARYILNPRLLPPGFWQREFGITPPEYRRNDPYAALHAIDAATIDSAFRAHFTPPYMTLLVVGDLDSTAVFRAAEASFGMLPAWPATAEPTVYRLKEGPTRRHFWNLRNDVAFTLGFRLDSLTADDHAHLIFARELLEYRLMRRLRWGEDPAVYGVGSLLTFRGQVGYLQLHAQIRPDAYQRARGIIADELQRLRHGRYPTGEFELDRAALTRQLRLNNGTPAALRGWHASTLYRPELRARPPALGGRFATITPTELSAFAARQLGPDRTITTVARPLPLPPALSVLGMGAALALGMALVRVVFLRPLEVRRIRYLARLRPPMLLRLAAALILIIGALVGLRLLAALLHHLAAAFLYGSSSFIVQSIPVLLALALSGFLALLLLTLVPVKILVLEQELRIKYWSYRSTRIAPDDIVELRLARFAEVWPSRRLWRTVPLAFGLRAPALLIRTRRGPDWFVAVRDTDELALEIAALRARNLRGADVWL